jgi:alpha-N-arabinofuranosidase
VSPRAAALTLDAAGAGPVIHRNIYGHFAEHLGRCIYEGLWVGEDSPIPHTRGLRRDVVAALQKLAVPILRWPGGCFADEYHWRDGVGPRELRPKMINTHWGGVVENNHFGTHEFFDLCAQLDCEPYICGNLGSGTVQEMQQWIEYMTSDADSPVANERRAHGRAGPWKLRYFGVGNESWGCGGSMRPEFYADNFLRYNTYVRNLSGNRIARIACGPANADYVWTETLMQLAGRHLDGLSLHYYTVTGEWTKKGRATEFSETEWHTTLRRTLEMDELIARHGAVMDRYDPARRVGLVVDEWGTWHEAEPGTNPGFHYQQNTLRDALAAALNFHIFHRHAARVTMANIAQTVNVLQAMVLTDRERMIVTPTYWVFEMYRVHQGATALPVALESPAYVVDGQSIPAVSATASRDAAGVVHLSLVNTDPGRPATVACAVTGGAGRPARGRILTAPAMNAHNTFDRPEAVAPADFGGWAWSGDTLTVALPAKSIVTLQLS